MLEQGGEQVLRCLTVPSQSKISSDGQSFELQVDLDQFNCLGGALVGEANGEIEFEEVPATRLGAVEEEEGSAVVRVQLADEQA
jgi:hypothetical protein